jgi:hypothetical protein
MRTILFILDASILLAIVLVAASIFQWGFGIGYKTKKHEKNNHKTTRQKGKKVQITKGGVEK